MNMITEQEVLARYAECIENIKTAAAASGRDLCEISVVGASKTMPKERVLYVKEHTGIISFGENRVQELIDKYAEGDGIDWHFIGQLQTNKVKYIIDKVSLIHSVDRLSLAEEIDRQARKRGITANVLIEVNMGREESKGGLFEENVDGFIQSMAAFKNICVQGLMSVMPNVEYAELDNFYLRLRALYDKIKNTKAENADIRYLSAGMSNDYALAIKHGANIVRLGRAVFGDR
jgi:pyridoxal phosphate enzyme, YggS family